MVREGGIVRRGYSSRSKTRDAWEHRGWIGTIVHEAWPFAIAEKIRSKDPPHTGPSDQDVPYAEHPSHTRNNRPHTAPYAQTSGRLVSGGGALTSCCHCRDRPSDQDAPIDMLDR